MQTVGSNQFKQQMGKYFDKIAKGNEVVITRNGEPFARLVPLKRISAKGSASPAKKQKAKPVGTPKAAIKPKKFVPSKQAA